MKADESRSTLPTKHQLEHEIPTVIHHPEEEQTLLARWLSRAMENPTRFWGLVGAVVVVAVGLSVLSSGLTLGRATSDEAWAKLETAKTAGERVEIAKEFPKTPAERWALLQAAGDYFNQGFNGLPADKDVALPNLKKALDLFQKVADEAPQDSPQARVAALGVARSLEASNNLDKALKQYEKVAQTKAWAGTEEVRTAEKLAKTLNTPEAREFYKNLYAFKPPEVTLPPGGVGNIPISLPDNHPPVDGVKAGSFAVPAPGATAETPSAEPSPEIVPPPPSSPAAKPETPKKAESSDSLPGEVFAPKAETPKAAGLPGDVFTPAAPK